ncbi:MAG: acyltransferase [Rhodospirillales bacterium]|nr:acyltransferase [Rhodospirillales bacterium]QQS14605.1 MAG: acyltransferase [Rhodospirillales bacterium]
MAGTGSSATFRFDRLDALRFLAALWVALGHGAAPQVPAAWIGDSVALHIVVGLYKNLFNGQAAVIVFFLISGFCVHFPQRAGGAFDPVAHLLRRSFRLVPPMLAAMFAARALGIAPAAFDGIIWTLYAELVFYALYPVLLAVARRHGWGPVVLAAYALAFATLVAGQPTPFFDGMGMPATWALGLPCWLLGCLLADRLDAPNAGVAPARSRATLWALRLAVIGAAVVCSALRFKTAIGHTWTLPVYALLAYLWLSRELVDARDAGGDGAFWRHCARAGTWSYSLYLTHLLVLLPGRALDAPAGVATVAAIPAMLVVAYAFHRAVERPSHEAARALAALWTGKRRPGAAAAIGD